MITKEEVLEEINQYFGQPVKDDFFNNTLLILLNIYKKLRHDIIIDNVYYTHKNFHTIAMKNPNILSYNDIELDKYGLLFRFELIECYFDYEDDFFIVNREKIVTAYLKGQYKLIRYFDDENYSIDSDLFWDDDTLSRYNSINKIKKKIAYTEEIIGQCFLED